MTKKKVKQLMDKAFRHFKVANVYMVYDKSYYNLIPIKMDKKLFLAIDEDDFIFDGFRISRFKDIKKFRIKNDKCDEIIKNEGLCEGFVVPEIDITSWQAVFEDLKQVGKNIIVEYKTAEGTSDSFTIGKIVSVYKNYLYMHHFDADGVWESKPSRIPYNEVTSVTFDSRYVNIFSKYISDPPQ